MKENKDIRYCHSCGEIHFTIFLQYENEVMIKCDECGITAVFYSKSDFEIQEE